MATAKKTTKKTAAKKSSKQKKAPAKSTEKKSVKRKAPAKKTASKKSTKQTIRIDIYEREDLPEEQHFYFVNGHKVKNVRELAEIMDRIEQEVFDFHVNPDKNDFYNWVRHVFDDLELAEKLVGVTGPKHLQFTIYKHIADKALKK